ncbi:MAG: hypothetical protein Q9M48_00550 [Rhodobacterales bacterium]|nr:hypothetical protein [Rhodobacterales bacterium]
MKIHFGLTYELTNTQYAPLVALAAYYEAEKVFEPLQSVTSASRQGDFTLSDKLLQLVLSIMAGCEYVSLVNTKLRPERKFAQLYRIDCFADQSTLSRGLYGLTQMNLVQLEVAVRQICDRCSQTRQHDWRGFLELDFDLSALPCGKQAEGGKKGYGSGKKTPLCAN